MVDHDRSYKLLFSFPEMVRDLLEGFVCEDWLAQLDYASLEPVNSAYVSNGLRVRLGDMVWKVRWGSDSRWIYLLLEFQSSVDPYMALRVLTYAGLLYEELLRANQLADNGRLPLVYCLVLYNGSARWRAAQELTALTEPRPTTLHSYQPQMRFRLIDERRYTHSELAPRRNLAAALFRLENCRSGADVDDVLTLQIERLDAPEHESLRRAFNTCIQQVILARNPEFPVTKLGELKETGMMLSERIDELCEERKQEGLKQGLQQGEAAFLVRLLQKRFGELPHSLRERLERAPTEQLEHWGERLLSATSLEALFDEDRGVWA